MSRFKIISPLSSSTRKYNLYPNQMKNVVDDGNSKPEKMSGVQIVLICALIIISVLIVAILIAIIYTVKKNRRKPGRALHDQNDNKRRENEEARRAFEEWNKRRHLWLDERDIPPGYVYDDRTDIHISSFTDKKHSNAERKGSIYKGKSVKQCNF